MKAIADGGTILLPLNVTFLKSGLARVTLDEAKRRAGDIELRHGSKARKERYNEAPAWALVGGLDVDTCTEVQKETIDSVTTIHFGENQRSTTIIHHDPFSIEFQRDGKTQVKFNSRGFMNIEHWRPKIDNDSSNKVSTEDESTWWEESFGGNTDTKPKGPESVALDILFPGYEYVFGIPEHAGPLSLRETRYELI